jgi:hypothetical protein
MMGGRKYIHIFSPLVPIDPDLLKKERVGGESFQSESLKWADPLLARLGPDETPFLLTLRNIIEPGSIPNFMGQNLRIHPSRSSGSVYLISPHRLSVDQTHLAPRFHNPKMLTTLTVIFASVTDKFPPILTATSTVHLASHREIGLHYSLHPPVTTQCTMHPISPFPSTPSIYDCRSSLSQSTDIPLLISVQYSRYPILFFEWVAIKGSAVPLCVHICKQIHAYSAQCRVFHLPYLNFE